MREQKVALMLRRRHCDLGVRVSAIHERRFAGQRQQKAREARKPPRSDLELVAQADRTLELLHGKWKVHLLVFMARGVHRPSRLLECLPGASKKMMIDTLRALARDGIVDREIFAEVPARVEYSLTALGWSLSEPLIALAEWGQAHPGHGNELRWPGPDAPGGVAHAARASTRTAA
jgi:DNA-binding HxlR family transcriptional regulator